VNTCKKALANGRTPLIMSEVTQQSKSSTTGQGETLSFEAALEQLQLTVKKLESGELSLEDALRQFENGVRLTRACQEHLSAAERRIEILTQTSTEGRADLQPFSVK
jgi:exodeoxyribonuclease VII small subunit